MSVGQIGVRFGRVPLSHNREPWRTPIRESARFQIRIPRVIAGFDLDGQEIAEGERHGHRYIA
jgi:hypothetical protein